MQCCILGGGGFIGINLARFLKDRGCKVRIFGRPSAYASYVPDAEHQFGEFADVQAVRRAVEGCDIVFHLIGATNPVTAEGNKILDLRENVENTLRLLDFGLNGAYGRLVFLSSGGTVYGIQKATPVQESSEQWPISSYGVTKLTIERYLHMYGYLHSLDYRIARVSNPFGEFQISRKGQGVIGTLLRCVVQGETFKIVGDGSVVRDYLYIADTCEALWALACYQGAERIFNVASGIGHSVMDLVGLVEEIAGHPVERSHLPSRPIDVPINILDVSRAARELDWRPRTAMKDALALTLAWVRNVNHCN